MRFQDHLLLQKQHAEEQERQAAAQKILDEASVKINAVYQSRRNYRDPIEESRERIKALQRRAASTSATTLPGSAIDEHSIGGLRSSVRSNVPLPQPVNPDYVTREVTVRHLNDHTNLNPTAFRLYRKLRFG